MTIDLLGLGSNTTIWGGEGKAGLGSCLVGSLWRRHALNLHSPFQSINTKLCLRHGTERDQAFELSSSFANSRLCITFPEFRKGEKVGIILEDLGARLSIDLFFSPIRLHLQPFPGEEL